MNWSSAPTARRPWIGLVAIILLIALTIVASVYSTNPAQVNQANILKIASEIAEYARLNHQLPGRIDSLGLDAKRLRDYWGSPIEYQILGDNQFILTSLGADLKSGGVDDARDDKNYFVIQDGRAKYIDPRKISAQP